MLRNDSIVRLIHISGKKINNASRERDIRHRMKKKKTKDLTSLITPQVQLVYPHLQVQHKTFREEKVNSSLPHSHTSSFTHIPVSYTHLDVYKRQHTPRLMEELWTITNNKPQRQRTQHQYNIILKFSGFRTHTHTHTQTHTHTRSRVTSVVRR